MEFLPLDLVRYLCRYLNFISCKEFLSVCKSLRANIVVLYKRSFFTMDKLPYPGFAETDGLSVSQNCLYRQWSQEERTSFWSFAFENCKESWGIFIKSSSSYYSTTHDCQYFLRHVWRSTNPTTQEIEPGMCGLLLWSLFKIRKRDSTPDQFCKSRSLWPIMLRY